jgi:cystathionine beta-lyase
MAEHPPQVIDRTGTHSIKWDYRAKLFGRSDILPLWVADMDFESPVAVKEALQQRVAHGTFGYTGESFNYYKGILDWINTCHGWSVDRHHLHYLPGIIPGLNWAVQTFTDPGDGVVIQPPVYKPFFQAIQHNNRELKENPLQLVNNHYQMDLEHLESLIDERTKMVILCSPHNPVGRVWTSSELKALGDICVQNGILIVSDEIHWDIVYGKASHYPTANLNDDLKQQTLTLTSPGKTFNLQGLQSAYAIAENPQIREAYWRTLQQNGIFLNNALSITAIEAAYNHGSEWLDSTIQYLEENRQYLIDFAYQNLPGINVITSEGTYLAWLDCRELNLSQAELNMFFVNQAKLGLNDGSEFGEAGKGFMRLNFACARTTLEQALNQLKEAYNEF